ncbi:hypothetical protein [Enterococcus sp. UD-01]|jgi:hypothetical protein|uniref:hypothetical protein n=1 Tax=Enterococcus sp. UD-01 TaxID=3373911 RepID=UPI0038396DD3
MNSSLLNYQLKEDIEFDGNVWTEMNVNYERILSEEDLETVLTSKLISYNVEIIDELSLVKKIKPNSDETKETKVNKIVQALEEEEISDWLLLLDFSVRKRKSILHIYVERFNVRYNHFLPQIIDIFEQDEKRIIDIFIDYLWAQKASGSTFNINGGELDIQRLYDALKDITSLVKFSEGISNKHLKLLYKVHSVSEIDNSIIVHIYRQKGDSTLPDFDEAVRNKEVESLLLLFNSEENIIEFKRTSLKDLELITDYFETEFNLVISEIEDEVFTNYESNNVREAFLYGRPVEKNFEYEVEEFRINEIVFRTSNLKFMPEISLKNERNSIIEATQELSDKKIIRFDSLKNIKSILVNINGHKRKIRPSIHEDGNITLLYNDGDFDKNTKKMFENIFQSYFGIPLLRKLSNTRFREGRAEKVDYLMSLSLEDEVEYNDQSILKELKDQQFIHINNENKYYCNSCNLEVLQSNEQVICECGSDSYSIKEIKNIEIDNEKATKFVIDKFCNIFGFENEKTKSQMKIRSKSFNYNLLKKNTNELAQVLVVDTRLTNNEVKHLIQSLTPTIIVTLGVQNKEVDNLKEKGLFAISFGELFIAEESLMNFDKVQAELNEFFLQKKLLCTKAADYSIKRLKKVFIENERSDYTEDDFEDDVFALLKELVPNSVKWGKEKKGKAYPEGIFAISTRDTLNKKINMSFSFDCKFNKDEKGYDLTSSEKRKAVEYVEGLNRSSYINRFSDSNYLSLHIFVSNKFKEKQKVTMKNHFEEHLDTLIPTKPAFLTISCLIHIFDFYRNHFEEINKERNAFYACLIRIFHMQEITIKGIDEIFEDVLDIDLSENKFLNVDKVKLIKKAEN